MRLWVGAWILTFCMFAALSLLAMELFLSQEYL